jgi:hypothetical protein
LIDPTLSLGLGVLAGVIVVGTRLRPLARLMPVVALGLVGATYALSVPVVAGVVLPALVGAGLVGGLFMLLGGK